MEPRDRFRPAPGGEPPPALLQIQQAIDLLDREDRASLRPWILARYDVRGYRAGGYVTPDGSARAPSAAAADDAAGRP